MRAVGKLLAKTNTPDLVRCQLTSACYGSATLPPFVRGYYVTNYLNRQSPLPFPRSSCLRCTAPYLSRR
jgi:hypothetical protein